MLVMELPQCTEIVSAKLEKRLLDEIIDEGVIRSSPTAQRLRDNAEDQRPETSDEFEPESFVLGRETKLHKFLG